VIAPPTLLTHYSLTHSLTHSLPFSPSHLHTTYNTQHTPTGVLVGSRVAHCSVQALG
jgi:hypothetical protein